MLFSFSHPFSAAPPSGLAQPSCEKEQFSAQYFVKERNHGSVVSKGKINRHFSFNGRQLHFLVHVSMLPTAKSPGDREKEKVAGAPTQVTEVPEERDYF